MTKLTAIAMPIIQDFISYQKASGRWGDSICDSRLLAFYNYCHSLYPNATTIAQEMVNHWCHKRDTESNNSCLSRTSIVISLITFVNKREMPNLNFPPLPKRMPNTYIPHAFTEIELQNFFMACDSIKGNRNIAVKNRKTTIPVFFRLLYSSGIRTTEARQLRLKDVDLNEGVLNIQRSKGRNQHFIVLHESMLDLMKRYDAVISMLFPCRTYFFPAVNDKFHTNLWVSRNFKKLWYQKNVAHAIAYDLRHHYAIENINRWTGEGMGFHANLLYLSKSMGHRSLKSTTYYYSLTPILADILIDKTNESFNTLIPEVE